MKFVIKPHDQSLNVLLETSQYQHMWRAHSRRILAAFTDVTRLEFQQRLITARVHPDIQGSAGVPHQPMHLPAHYSTEQVKLITLVHELCHRLLGGNALGPVGLGLIPDEATPHPDFQEYEHRHTYLFEYDVIEKALGPEYASLCRQQEEHYGIDGPHDRAWAWAMGMPYEQRQRAVKILTEQALPRDRWHERDDIERIPPREPIEWFRKLANA